MKPPTTYIHEMPVYDGRTKEWRILNLASGSIYAMTFENEAEAFQAIEDGALRANCLVQATSLGFVRDLLQHAAAGCAFVQFGKRRIKVAAPNFGIKIKAVA